MPASHPDTAPAGPDQGRDPAAPTVGPDGGEVSHLEAPPGGAPSAPSAATSAAPQPAPPEEPPEVEALLAVVRPWQILLVLAVASVWLPAVLAGYGKRLARADRVAAEARWAADDAAILAANPPGDCDSYAILRQGTGRSDLSLSGYGGALHVEYADDKRAWVPVDDGESPENAARFWSGMPGTQAPDYRPGVGYVGDLYRSYYLRFSYRSFPSRVAATYQPGSIFYEHFHMQAPLASVLQEALDCDTWPMAVGPDRYAAMQVEWPRYNEGLFYMLHYTACQRDWTLFQQTCDVVFTLGSRQPYFFPGILCDVFGVILEQHGAAMPAVTLLDLRSRLLALQQVPPDVDQTVAEWKRTFLEEYFSVILGPKDLGGGWGGGFYAPLFLQRYAIFYPLRGGRTEAYGARLREEIRVNLDTPGRQKSGFPVDGGIVEILGGGQWAETGAIGLSARLLSERVEVMECGRQANLRMLIAALDALLIRAESGAWPVAITALGEPLLRVDPYNSTAAPLGYRVDATGALRVWSIGYSGVDGGGLFSSEPGCFDQDMIQRVEPPVVVAGAQANGQAEVAP